MVVPGASVLASSGNGGGGTISGGSMSHAAVLTAAATTIAAPTIKPGRVMEKVGRWSRSCANNSRHWAGPRRCRAMPHDDHKRQQ